jgi:hypothetical protein
MVWVVLQSRIDGGPVKLTLMDRKYAVWVGRNPSD